MIGKVLTRIIVICIALTLWIPGVVSGDTVTPPKKNILLLNSYNEGYVWTDGIVSAVVEKLQNSKINSNIDIEYMNTKQVYDDQYFDKLYELYKYKYSKIKYNVIIASDDDAYRFLTKYRDKLFPGVPVVFCSVNDTEEVRNDRIKGFTGIVEEIGFDATVDMIKAVHPDIKRIHVITDKTTMGGLVVKDIKTASAKSSGVAFTIEQTESIDEALSELHKLDVDSAVVLATTSIKDLDGNILSIDEAAEKVVERATVPVYGLWDFYMGSGVVACKVNSSKLQGEAAAKLALDILNGRSVDKLAVEFFPSRQFEFDYNELKKLHIDESRLPKGSKIVNKPHSSYNLSANVLWSSAVLILLTLTFVNFLLLINIKKRKRAEDALQQSEGIIRATLNATAEGILVTSLDKNIIDCNALFLRMWRFPSDYLESKDLNIMFEYALRHIRNSEKHLEWAEKCFLEPKPAFDTVYLLDGRVLEVYSEALIIQDEMRGRVWSFKDITARKRAELELHRSQERYKRLVELSPDAIFMAVDGRNIFSNAAGVELLGAGSEGEIYGKDITDFMYGTYSRNVTDYLEGKAEHNRIFPLVEMKLKRMDNSFVDVEASTTAFDYNGHNAVLSVVRDITERKEAELLKKSIEEKTKQLNEAWEYDKLKTEFFANISHELRTPINVILGAEKLFGLLLEDIDLGGKREKITKYVFMMRQNCYRLTRLVNNLIDITRLDAGFFSINLKNYDIVNIVECITLSVVEYVQEKGIELVFDTQMEERIIACDADKIERIMLNLLSNSIKFTNKGGSINVNIHEEANEIIISVSDTGIGIPEEKLKTVFERFVQVDKSFVRNREGSGIGLSLVKSLAELHGGSIDLTSQMDKGTTFKVRLPITLVAEDEAAATADVTYQSSAERISVEFSDIYFD